MDERAARPHTAFLREPSCPLWLIESTGNAKFVHYRCQSAQNIDVGLILMALGEGRARSQRMQDILGIAILITLAVCFRLCFHSTTFVVFTWRDVGRVVGFNLIAFWVLLATAGLWFLFATFAFALRPR